MDYFWLTQDSRIPNLVKVAGISKIQSVETLQTEAEPEHIFIKEQAENVYVDFIERPVPIVSNQLKQLFKSFDQKCSFSPVVLADIKHGSQQLYWRIHPFSFRPRATDLEFSKDQMLQKLTLEAIPSADLRVFQVDRITDCLIFINLIVLEGMLRRGLTGFTFIPVELAAKS